MHVGTEPLFKQQRGQHRTAALSPPVALKKAQIAVHKEEDVFRFALLDFPVSQGSEMGSSSSCPSARAESLAAVEELPPLTNDGTL